MSERARRHRGYWAFLGHRLSGIGLAAFLPPHFLLLGRALESAAALDNMLAYTALAPVKLAEGGLVGLLALHLGFGLRLLAIELGPWGAGAERESWVLPCAGAAAMLAGTFVWLAL